MGRVICDMSMSLDGFVTGPNDSPDNPFGDGADTLHEWLFDAATEADKELLDEAVTGIGAVVMGRKSFDKCVDVWGPNGVLDGAPSFVLTHREPPAEYPAVYQFVGDVPEAIKLERTRAVVTPAATHLFYRVLSARP